MKKEEPILVAIQCLVYNHEPYLRDCFEGFVMQKTNFRFVAIVHEDCSTDHSASIIREYEAKYPDIFRPIYETENQYSKHDGSLERIMNAAIDATGAKYIAMCEGDDYWIDPFKLQKQVDFLETHPDYSLCCHGYKILKVDAGLCIEKFHMPIENHIEGVTFSNSDNWKYRYTSTMTIIYRYAMHKNIPDISQFRYWRDAHLHYYLLKYGKGYFMPFIGSVYRDHGGGVYSSLSALQKDLIHVWIYDELFTNNPDDPDLGAYLRELIKEQEKIFIWLIRDQKLTTELIRAALDLSHLIWCRIGIFALLTWKTQLSISYLKRFKRMKVYKHLRAILTRDR